MLTYFVVLGFRFAPWFLFSFQFIYASFSDADSGLDSSVYFRMVGLLVNWKGCERKRSWFNWGGDEGSYGILPGVTAETHEKP